MYVTGFGPVNQPSVNIAEQASALKPVINFS
jgi:hypothetical protein